MVNQAYHLAFCYWEPVVRIAAATLLCARTVARLHRASKIQGPLPLPPSPVPSEEICDQERLLHAPRPHPCRTTPQTAPTRPSTATGTRTRSRPASAASAAALPSF